MCRVSPGVLESLSSVGALVPRTHPDHDDNPLSVKHRKDRPLGSDPHPVGSPGCILYRLAAGWPGILCQRQHDDLADGLLCTFGFVQANLTYLAYPRIMAMYPKEHVLSQAESRRDGSVALSVYLVLQF